MIAGPYGEMSLTTPIVDVEKLIVRYGDFEAVKGITFQVFKGEVFGLLGPNGAGKSTTINVLSCLLPPAAGSVRIAGFDSLRQRERVKKAIGVVPQDIAVYPTLSGRENLAFFGRVAGLRGKRLQGRILEVLRIVGLTGQAGQIVEKYSGGMKRRLNLAIGLIHEPQILFLDEPTAGVDPQSRNRIFESIEALRDQGLSVIYTTHYMEEAERLCHRVGIMDDGRLIAIDTVKNLVALVGGGIVNLTVTDASGAPSILEDLRKLPSIEESSISDGHIKAKSRNAQRCLLDILSILERANVGITSLEILEPNLESVFLHLTGKRLRDGDR